MFTKLKEITLEFFKLSLGIRLTVGVLLGAIGSSSLIGFLSEYAAVSYTLANGVRLPTEGLPYLRYAATAISFSLFILALGSFFGIYAFLSFLLKVAFMHSRRAPENVGSLPLLKYLLVFGPGAVVATQPLVGTMSLGVGRNLFPEYVPLITVSAVIALLLVFGRRPQWLTWFTLVVYVVGTIAIVGILFTPKLYGGMLAFIRFGGGVPIEITRNCRDVSPCVSKSQGNLFLRTQDYFLLIDNSDKRITEIPSSTIIEYKYLGANRWAGE